MNFDLRRGHRDQRKSKASSYVIFPAFINLIVVVASSLLLTACSPHGPAQQDATEPTLSVKGPGIEQMWPEQDRLVQTHLAGYGWVNRAKGIVHIPIEQAMNLIVTERKSSGPTTETIMIPSYEESDADLQSKGRHLFKQYGCTVCHDPDAVSHAPSLVGIYGQRVRLSDGTFVLADDQYLHDSIMLSKKQVVAGYVAVMPDYGSIIPKPDVQELINYLKSAGPASISGREAVHSP
jgi:mono/diheme cytochrome c family protein